MPQPYIGQLALFAFDFAPKNWALCNGQLLPIAQNQALFMLIGTQFGGDGFKTFAVPDLQGRIALGGRVEQGKQILDIGRRGGEATHTLTIAETPPHTHLLMADAMTDEASNNPRGRLPARSHGSTENKTRTFAMYLYAPVGPHDGKLAPDAVGTTGGQPHDNMMPSLGLNYCIALQGDFPKFMA